jgi:alpha-D-ribose 1-methylphosphonate 5-triphosphate synthase subunit PhnH
MRASFGVIRPDASPPQFKSFAAGDPRYPDRSTTLIVLCDSFVGGEALTLEGPGIETSVRIAPSGVPATFIDQAVDNHTLYPCGLDVLLLAGRELVGLPRSTRIIRGTR